jgi:MinD superfamily P-loop ATPase
MIIAVASGKGGTGKTTIAVNLALIAGQRVSLLDCDVEEPNCHIFLKPDIEKTESAGLLIPTVDEQKCNACGECGRFCQYNAIVSLKTKPLVFPELCHGCGGCTLVCPEQAIAETFREIGVVEIGSAGALTFVQGRLHVGEAMAPPLIRAVKQHASQEHLTIIDAPPGTSCPVIAAVQGVDFAILVTEPTPFGLNDLILAVETIRQLGISFGVVINRSDIGDDRVVSYCRGDNIPVLAEIPHDRKIAEAYSRGETLVTAVPEICGLFGQIYQRVRQFTVTHR